MILYLKCLFLINSYLCDVVILRLTHSEQHVREHFSRFDEKIMVRRVLSLTMRNAKPYY